MARAEDSLGLAPPNLEVLLHLVLETAGTPTTMRNPRGKVCAILQGRLNLGGLLAPKGGGVPLE